MSGAVLILLFFTNKTMHDRYSIYAMMQEYVCKPYTQDYQPFVPARQLAKSGQKTVKISLRISIWIKIF